MKVAIPEWFVIVLATIILVRSGMWLKGFFKTYTRFRTLERLVIWLMVASPWLTLLFCIWNVQISVDLVLAYIVLIHCYKPFVYKIVGI